jgi:hypothetical protein
MVAYMSLPVHQTWRMLLQELDPNSPPRDMRLYVKPRHSSTDKVVRDLRANPTAFNKFLLVGARGGGKSTELRAIRDELRKDDFLLAEVDLDRSGIQAASVSAYDLLYLSGLALLKFIPDEEERQGHFEQLAERYAAGDKEVKRSLGTLEAALAGTAQFATVAAAAATATGLAPGVVPALGSLATLGGTGVRLLGSKNFVAESSPLGRNLQDITDRIARAARGHHGGRPLCVLIDGLEKMNGEASERFRQVFVDTRLLINPEWAAVIAAPPCTLAQTYSVHEFGVRTYPVYGFGPDSLDQLVRLLKLRFKLAGLDPGRAVIDGGLDKIATRSGGLPRHAIAILQVAVSRASNEGTNYLSWEQIDTGIYEKSLELALGLTDKHMEILAEVRRRSGLPGDLAASLFSDGRILVHPPAEGRTRPQSVVHPLLLREVEEFERESLSG